MSVEEVKFPGNFDGSTFQCFDIYDIDLDSKPEISLDCFCCIGTTLETIGNFGFPMMLQDNHNDQQDHATDTFGEEEKAHLSVSVISGDVMHPWATATFRQFMCLTIFCFLLLGQR